MTSIKVKFRPSTVDGKEGGLYFQIIHNRVVRQLNTDYKVFAEAWDAESESVIVNGNRTNLLLGIQERLAWDVARLGKVVHSLETEHHRFTADDVITMFHKLTKESSLFTFIDVIIFISSNVFYELSNSPTSLFLRAIPVGKFTIGTTTTCTNTPSAASGKE